MERLRDAVAKNPADAHLRIRLANALDDSGNPEAAIAEYREALRLEPHNAVAFRNLGITHLRQGQWAEAEQALREAVRCKPNYLVARCDFADVLVRKKDIQRAFEEYQLAIRQDRRGVAGLRGFNSPPEL